MPVNVSTHEPFVDVFHGVRVPDPYRWLEDRISQPTQHWIEVQQQQHNNYFEHLPGIEALRARVCKLLNRDTLDQPTVVGTSLFFCRRRKGEEQASIYLRNAETVTSDPSLTRHAWGPTLP